MHLITPLASGINGAESGTAYVYKRGTTTSATWYSDFEGTGASTATVTLDSNGGAAVYVNELVTVKAYDVSGNLVRTFTAGVDSPAVEVKSQSFTGTDYSTAVSAAGNPTTLQAVLDAWKTSAGTIDFNVLVSGSDTKLSTIASYLSGVVYNVVSYGATGDGATDDSSSIQAAINAANTAGGGVVFFPDGTYYCGTTTLSVYTGITLLGVGKDISKLTCASGVSTTFLNGASGTNAIRISDLSVEFSSTTGAASLIESDAPLYMTRCGVGTSSIIPTFGVDCSADCYMYDCTITCEAVPILMTGSGTLWMMNCTMNSTTATGTGDVIFVELQGTTDAIVLGCDINMEIAAPTASFAFKTNGTGNGLSVMACKFNAAASGTYSIFSLNATTTFFNVSNCEIPSGLASISSANIPAGSQVQRTSKSTIFDATNTDVSGSTMTVDGSAYHTYDFSWNDSVAYANPGDIALTGTPVHGATLVIVIRAGANAGATSLTMSGNHTDTSFSLATSANTDYIVTMVYTSEGWIEFSTASAAT